MKLIRNVLAAALCAQLLSGCVYLNATYPLDQDMNQTPVGSKVGRATQYSVLWAVAWGDSGIQAAASNGGLKVIHNADTHIDLYLFGLYARRTTIVYGE
jgi:TRL-like protein family